MVLRTSVWLSPFTMSSRTALLFLALSFAMAGCGNSDGNKVYKPGRTFRYVAETFRGDTLVQKAYLRLSVRGTASQGVRVSLGGAPPLELFWELDSLTGLNDSSFGSEEVLVDEESNYELAFPGKLFDFIRDTRPLRISSRDLDTLPSPKETFVSHTMDEHGSVSIGTEREVLKHEKLRLDGGREFTDLVKVFSLYTNGKQRIQHIYFFDSKFGFISSQYFLGSRKSVVLTLLPPF